VLGHCWPRKILGMLNKFDPDFPVPARITRVYIANAPTGRTMNQRTKGPNASIDLNWPGIKHKNVILGNSHIQLSNLVLF
jgi:hypothetical protein